MQAPALVLLMLATLALGAGAVLPARSAAGLRRASAIERAARELARDVRSFRVKPQDPVDENQRVVPVTRRRLRPRSGAVGWPAMVEPERTDFSPEERGRILHLVIGDGDAARRSAVLSRVVFEEDGDLRLTALKALVSQRDGTALDAFRDVLRSGSDAERSLAIDGLVALGATDDLVPALADRLELLAAKAALGLCATRRRADLLELMAPHVEVARREAVVALLSGFFDD